MCAADSHVSRCAQLENCKKVNVMVHSVIASVEVMNSKGCKVQVQTLAPTVTSVSVPLVVWCPSFRADYHVSPGSTTCKASRSSSPTRTAVLPSCRRTSRTATCPSRMARETRPSGYVCSAVGCGGVGVLSAVHSRHGGTFLPLPQLELPIPEQFVTKINNDNTTSTEVSEIYG